MYSLKMQTGGAGYPTRALIGLPADNHESTIRVYNPRPLRHNSPNLPPEPTE
jgi:hypothetical protein